METDDEGGQGNAPPAATRSMRLMKLMNVGSGGGGGDACDGDDYDWGSACDNNCDGHCPFEDDSSTRTATGVMSLFLGIGMAVCACVGCFNSRRVQMYVASSPAVVAIGEPVRAEAVGQGTPIS